jgi:uncharacterized protein (TIGR02453 family)
MGEFKGFPGEGIQFLRDLGQNNIKTWFEAHKQTYLDVVQAPALALVVALGERLQARFPDVHYDTRTNGSGSLMRIYRDTRFSADKSPYKTNIAMVFASGTGKKMEAPGFGLQITPENVGLVAGMFGFPKPLLETYRQAVLDDKRGQALDEAAEAVRRAGNYTIEGEEYKRVPSGYDADHPRANWLKFTGLYAFAPEISLEVAQTPALVDAAMTHFVNMAPIQRWLAQALAA